MSKAAVICEFNPFHNGHKFLIENIKSNHADDVICVMSGSFVQRGDIAVTDKYARAEAALTHGADMAAELPAVYAMAPAEVFAKSGVRLAHVLGCDKLCFGAESSIEELSEALDTLDSESVQTEIARRMCEGDYYPRAVGKAIGGRLGEIVSRPNNILAVEYIRACRGCDIEPVAIPRKGADHDSSEPVGNIASATKIRDLIKSGEEYRAYTPMSVDRPAFIEAIEPAVLYRLKTMTADELSRIADVSEGLENRIADVAAKYNSLAEITDNLKTKRYTMARLRRILLSATLGITKEMRETPVPYIRVLGVRADKRGLISSRSLPLIADVRRGYDSLDISAQELFNIDLKATELMNIATGMTKNEFSTGLIICRGGS